MNFLLLVESIDKERLFFFLFNILLGIAVDDEQLTHCFYFINQMFQAHAYFFHTI